MNAVVLGIFRYTNSIIVATTDHAFNFISSRFGHTSALFIVGVSIAFVVILSKARALLLLFTGIFQSVMTNLTRESN